MARVRAECRAQVQALEAAARAREEDVRRTMVPAAQAQQLVVENRRLRAELDALAPRSRPGTPGASRPASHANTVVPRKR